MSYLHCRYLTCTGTCAERSTSNFNNSRKEEPASLRSCSSINKTRKLISKEEGKISQESGQSQQSKFVHEYH